MTTDARPRCPWPGADDLMLRYHDEEWGVPTHDERTLFEFLALEAAQAGLSWRTILHKREAFVRAFDGFHPAQVALLGDTDVERMLQDPGIVRNRLKLRAIVHNAQRFIEVQRELPRPGSFDDTGVPLGLLRRPTCAAEAGLTCWRQSRGDMRNPSRRIGFRTPFATRSDARPASRYCLDLKPEARLQVRLGR